MIDFPRHQLMQQMQSQRLQESPALGIRLERSVDAKIQATLHVGTEVRKWLVCAWLFRRISLASSKER